MLVNAAREAFRTVTKGSSKLCSSLDWGMAESVAQKIAESDLEVVWGTACADHQFGVLADAFRVAAVAQVSDCAKSGKVDLSACVEKATCQKAGDNSPLFCENDELSSTPSQDVAKKE